MGKQINAKIYKEFHFDHLLSKDQTLLSTAILLLYRQTIDIDFYALTHEDLKSTSPQMYSLDFLFRYVGIAIEHFYCLTRESVFVLVKTPQ